MPSKFMSSLFITAALLLTPFAVGGCEADGDTDSAAENVSGDSEAALRDLLAQDELDVVMYIDDENDSTLYGWTALDTADGMIRVRFTLPKSGLDSRALQRASEERMLEFGWRVGRASAYGVRDAAEGEILVVEREEAVRRILEGEGASICDAVQVRIPSSFRVGDFDLDGLAELTDPTLDPVTAGEDDPFRDLYDSKGCYFTSEGFLYWECNSGSSCAAVVDIPVFKKTTTSHCVGAEVSGDAEVGETPGVEGKIQYKYTYEQTEEMKPRFFEGRCKYTDGLSDIIFFAGCQCDIPPGDIVAAQTPPAQSCSSTNTSCGNPGPAPCGG